MSGYLFFRHRSDYSSIRSEAKNSEPAPSLERARCLSLPIEHVERRWTPRRSSSSSPDRPAR